MTQATVKQKRNGEKLFLINALVLFQFFMCLALYMVYNNIVIT